MNITVNIDDTQMSKLINDGINSLDAETVKNIAKQSLCEAFKNHNMVEEILFERKSYGGRELHRWAQDAISKTLTETDYDEFRGIIFAALKDHARDIIVETLAMALTANMFTFDKETSFTQRLLEYVRSQRN